MLALRSGPYQHCEASFILANVRFPPEADISLVSSFDPLDFQQMLRTEVPRASIAPMVMTVLYANDGVVALRLLTGFEIGL